MAEKEQTYDEQQAELRREAERAILVAIQVAAKKTPGPESMKVLAEAYSVMVGNRAPLKDPKSAKVY